MITTIINSVSAITSFFGCVSVFCIRDFYVRVGVFGVAVGQVFVDLVPQNVEDLGDIIVILGAALQELYSVFFCQCLSLSLGNLPLRIRHIGLIAHNNFGDVIGLALINLLDPVFETIKSFPIIDSIDQNDACSSFIIGLSNSFKSFLARSVPNLHFNFDPIDEYSFNLKIDPNGCNMGHLIFLINVAK